MKSFTVLALSFCLLQVFGNTFSADYQPVTEAHTTLQEILKEQGKFKDLIEKNITNDFQTCMDQIMTNECNLVDQWQSEIEKFKIENENSIKVEVPFLKGRKAKRVERLKQLIKMGDLFDEQMLTLVDQLKAEQADFQKSSWEIHQMYKLPEDTQIQLLEKKQIDVVHQLNAKIPRIAEKQVTTAQGEYDLGEISIQAQTVNEEMLSAYNKLDQALQSLQQSFELRQEEIQKEKNQIKEDITRLRALLDNEASIQATNLEKIAELEGKMTICETMPKSNVKDCGPLKIRASKMQTEMSILESRTVLIFQQIEKLMTENQSAEEVAAQKDSVKAMQEAAAMRREEMSYVDQEEVLPVPEPPKELKPKHHLKEKVD